MDKIELIENKSLASKAADIIRERIILGYNPQGSRITEKEFSECMGVSYSTIREAFNILEFEGLIKCVRNKHSEVVSFSDHDKVEIFTLRLALEKLCAEICLKNRSLDIEELRKQASIFTQVTEENLMKAVDADIGFHEIIVRSSGYIRVISMWNVLRSQVKMLIFAVNRSKPNESIPLNNHDHYKIIKAFENFDYDNVAAILSAHIIGGLELCLTYKNR